MKLSFSNIAWNAEQDDEMYVFLQSSGFCGLEIAPTRIFPNVPYDQIAEAREFAASLKSRFGLVISSIQSIWYGRSESIFGTDDERGILTTYTKKAVDFAAAIGSKNIVFGCPQNRNMPDGMNIQPAYNFFTEIARYAMEHSTAIAIEPNPPIYGTNFINRTAEAFELAKKIDNLMVNIDFGTIIENNEDLKMIADNIALVNHMHISEPNLVKIQKRGLHHELCIILKSVGYERFVSVEMKNPDNIESVKQTIEYIGGVFA